jgi:hypothetical protein
MVLSPAVRPLDLLASDILHVEGRPPDRSANIGV